MFPSGTHRVTRTGRRVDRNRQRISLPSWPAAVTSTSIVSPARRPGAANTRVAGRNHLDLPDLGETVPVLVNRRRTKAAFDLDDPSISPDARRKLGEQRHKAKAAAKKAEFEAKLSERD